MPHLTVSFSSNLVQMKNSSVLKLLNQTLLDSNQFDELDIKSRLVPLNDFLVGTGAAKSGFVHAQLAILSGRSADVKKALSTHLLQALQQSCEWPVDMQVQLSVEIQDIDRASYAKIILPECNY